MPVKSYPVKPEKENEESKELIETLKIPDNVFPGRFSSFKALLNAPTESAILLDNNGTVLAINEVGALRINRSVEDVINKRIFEIIPSDLAETRLSQIKKVIQAGKAVRFQDTRDGRDFDNNMYPVFDDNGAVVAVAVYARDITKDVKKEKALIESEAKYRMLVETMNDGIGMIDECGIISYVNDKYCEMIGYTKDEIEGKHVASFLDHENQEILKNQLSERKKGDVGSYEIEWIKKDNQKFATIMSARPIYDQNEFRGSFAVITDIENRKRIEKELRKSEEKYRSLVETTRDLVWEVGAKGFFTYMNPNCKNLLGYDQKELVGKSFANFIVEREQKTALDYFEKVRNLKESIDIFEITHVHKNGRERGFEVNVVPVLDKDGDFLGCKGISRDITKRKLAEKELAESEERYRMLVESSPDAITVIQEDSLKLINKEFTRLFGYTKKDLDKGLSPLTIVKPKDMKVVQQRINSRIAGEKLSPDKFYIECISKGGKNVPCESSAAQVQYNNQPASLVIFRDISKRKQAEKELQARAEDLEESNIALKVLLKQREKDKSEIEDKVLLNIEKLIMPDLERLKASGLDIRQKSHVSILESNLKEIATPFARTVSSKMLKLTPAEIQVANFVKQGKGTKEIADLLNLSPKTIEAHRKNIRNKLGIRNKKANLRSYLLNIGEAPPPE